jgi:hypothetical protein
MLTESTAIVSNLEGPEAMIEKNAIVMYKDDSSKCFGSCGIVEGIVSDQPDYVWVRWVGETTSQKESIQNLETI